VPVHPEDYVHRIGRTGRAGREGFAAMLVTPKDTKALKAIEKMLGQEIAWVDGPPSPEDRAQAESSERSDGRRRRGGRSRRGKDTGPKVASANGADKAVAQADAPKLQEPAATPQEAPQPQETASSDNGHEAKPRDAKPRETRARDDERRNGGRDRNKQGERKQGRSGQAGQDRAQDRSKGGSQPARSKGMGDHVPAFMMRPVRVP